MGPLQTTYATGAYTEREKTAVLGLWSVPGVGPRALLALREWAGGSLEPLLEMEISEFSNGAAVDFTVPVRQRLARVESLQRAAAEVLERAKASRMRVHFIGEVGYPENLATIEDAPPVLFAWGQMGAPRRRVAMVGSRNPENFFLPHARRLAMEVAQAGIGVVSGGAFGVDAACHDGAVAAGGETWAFVGSALDQLDPVPWKQVPKILNANGIIMSEYPPGVRADKTTFPRRNRLISGASDAVLVLRAAGKSGALHTATAALRQGRPLLAMPGEAHLKSAEGCNYLLKAGVAKACTGLSDILEAVGLSRGALRESSPAQTPKPSAEVMDALTDGARVVYGALTRTPVELDTIAESVPLSAGALTAALVELELLGLCLQYPGKVYEKV